MNLYEYVASSPMNYIDLWGLAADGGGDPYEGGTPPPGPSGLSAAYQGTVDFIRGAADSFSFGLTGWIRGAIYGDNGDVYYEGAYVAGEIIETGVEIAVTAGAASGKVIAKKAAQKAAKEALEEGAEAAAKKLLDPDIAKKINRFSKKSLKQQKKEYENLKKTYNRHLEKYGQHPGKTTGETNRMERELEEMRRILEERGQTGC